MIDKKKEFSLTDRVNSFKYAINGIKILFKEEHNARIHLVVSLGVICLSFLLKISLTEFCLILFSIGLVLASESINTSIENLANEVCSETSQSIKKVKDLVASAVLFCSISALLIGAIVFIPRIILLL